MNPYSFVCVNSCFECNFWIFIVCSIVTVPLLCVCSCCWDRVCWWPLSWAELRSNGWLLTERWWGDYLLTPSVMVSKRTLARYPSSLFSFSPLLVSSPLFAVSLTAHFPSMGLGGMHPQVTNASPFCFFLFRCSQRKLERHGTSTHTHTHTPHTHTCTCQGSSWISGEFGIPPCLISGLWNWTRSQIC